MIENQNFLIDAATNTHHYAFLVTSSPLVVSMHPPNALLTILIFKFLLLE
jgi:hypothetical protein